jgi:cold shock CspA family protein
MTGTVVCFFPRKGYGFINPDGSDGSRENQYFFHKDNCTNLPAVGQRVEFELGAAAVTGKSAQAVSVRPINTIVSTTPVVQEVRDEF